VILLDTHIWVWWVHGADSLDEQQVRFIEQHAAAGLAVSPISSWEVSLLVVKGRLELPVAVSLWVRTALKYPGVRVAPLTPDIMVAANELEGTFHPDPADRMLVATARALDCPIMTVDRRILDYPGCESTTGE
jgi:PIN domain nuclease of toxin-antitoxin system